MDRTAWVAAIVAYLKKEGARVDDTRLVSFAEEAFDRLGQFAPAEVAEAEWAEWPEA